MVFISRYVALLKKRTYYKKSLRKCFEITKTIERLQQNTLVRLRFSYSDSEQV